MSWIHAEDDILTHLTVAGEQFGVPVWRELMNAEQQARYASGRDAAVALRHPNGRPMRRHIVAVEDCVQAHLLAWNATASPGQTFMIAMNDPFDYVEAAAVRGAEIGNRRRWIWWTPSARTFAIDISKARYVLGYRPQFDIFRLIDQAIDFRRSGDARRQRAGYRG